LRLPFRILHYVMHIKPVHIIGVPLDLGGGRRGVDMGPSALRIAGLGDQIAQLGRTVVDKGDLPAPTRETKRPADKKKKYIREIAKICQRLYDIASKSLDEGAVPVVLGGDHSLAAGSVAASAVWVQRTTSKPLGLIWVDAHGDMNTPETTTSGNVHGMPLAALLGREPAELAAIGSSPSVLPQHTVLVGIRNLDEEEKAQIRAAGVHVFTMKDIDRDGIAKVAERALALASAATGGVHISFDMDVCDPAIAPGVGTPVKGGLDYREAHMVMELVADSRRLVALDLVEVNPTLDIRNATAEIATELALSALAKNIL
jgi:arginase